MAKVKYIRCDIYKRGINVLIGTPEELKKWCEKTYNEDEDDKEFNWSLKHCRFGLADFHYSCGGCAVIRLPKFPKTPVEIAYTAHEAFHATSWLLSYSGVDYDNENINNEAFAYLIEHLMRNILEKEGYEDA
jgi:hypothetical protein